jgi:hypothetical protein
MSLGVVGIMPADEAYKKKLAAYRACEEAGIAMPEELEKFFGHRVPNALGLQIDLYNHPSVEPYNEEGCEGYTIDVSKLPEGVRFVRVYASW